MESELETQYWRAQVLWPGTARRLTPEDPGPKLDGLQSHNQSPDLIISQIPLRALRVLRSLNSFLDYPLILDHQHLLYFANATVERLAFFAIRSNRLLAGFVPQGRAWI